MFPRGRFFFFFLRLLIYTGPAEANNLFLATTLRSFTGLQLKTSLKIVRRKMEIVLECPNTLIMEVSKQFFNRVSRKHRLFLPYLYTDYGGRRYLLQRRLPAVY